MHVGLDKNVNTTNTVQLDLFVFVETPVAHLRKVFAASFVFLVTFRENDILVEARGQFPTLLGFNPGIVVESSFDVPIVFVSMKPNICRPCQRKLYALIIGHVYLAPEYPYYDP